MTKKSIRQKNKNISKPISSQSWLFSQLEKRHIQAHLALTELRLSLAGRRNQVNTARRHALLDMLHAYWARGIFPKNNYNALKRMPVFIDDHGVYCAIGHLISETGNDSLARGINEGDKFVFLEQFDNSKVHAWLRMNGLSKEEAALVQPGYGGFVIERVEYTSFEKILGVMSLAASVVLILLILIALKALRAKSLPKAQKRNQLAITALLIAVLVIGLFAYLPTPIRAVKSLTPGEVGAERIICDGWGTLEDKHLSICNQFSEEGEVPGWREVPCEEVCIY